MSECPLPQVPDIPRVSPRGMRLVVYAGPTGGHIFPAQSFSEGFYERYPDSQIDLVTCRRAKPLVDQMSLGVFHSVSYLPEFGFSKGFSWKTLKLLFLFPYLFLQAFFFLRRIQPDLCVGFGSFVSFPGLMTARWLKCPTLIHEQNMIPGKATQWLLPHMDAVAESFEGTRFHQKPKSLHSVGLPLRAFILDAALRAKEEARTPRPFTILVLGGSQGAHGLNRIVSDAIACLSHEERSKIAVIHITGKQDQAWITERYDQLTLPYQVHAFYSEMDEFFCRADLAITRAGASTLFELAAFGVPAIVIPYPHAGGHQLSNAQNFAGKGGLVFHEEGPASKDWLVKQLRRYIDDRGLLACSGKAMKGLAKPDATDELIKIARKLIEAHEDRKR